MANLPFDSYSSPKSAYPSMMDPVDSLTTWSYATAPYSNNANANTNSNNDSLDVLQHYDMNQWAQQTSTWQTLLDDWIPPPGSEHEQKVGLLDLPSVSLPPTPPNQTPTSSIGMDFLAYIGPSSSTTTKDMIQPLSSCSLASSFGTGTAAIMDTSSNTSCSSMSSSPSSSVLSLSPPPVSTLSLLPSTTTNAKYLRRCSENPLPRANRPYRRRASSQPSVASVVSLTAHEPTSKYIDGVEYITFLYSHERLVKEYMVRTDVATVNVDTLPLVFKAQNTIYPRANVERSKYDGNRWDYETTCNTLGWQLCWLNQTQLCGQRGLIQRAVDSYRNCHAEMRSRRVARQQKVANGTLRKRKSRKSIVSPLV